MSGSGSGSGRGGSGGTGGDGGLSTSRAPPQVSVFSDLCSCFSVDAVYARLNDAQQMFSSQELVQPQRQRHQQQQGLQQQESRLHRDEIRQPLVQAPDSLQMARLGEVDNDNYNNDNNNAAQIVMTSAASDAFAKSPIQEEEEEEEEEALSACIICFDRPTTHTCSPCGHAACEPCLNKWRDDGHERCMICNETIKSVDRVANVVPQMHEQSVATLEQTLEGLVVLLDSRAYEVMHALLDLKDGVLRVQGALDRTLDNVAELVQRLANGSSVDGGEAAAVVHVEAAVLQETLDDLLDVVGDGNTGSERTSSENSWVQSTKVFDSLLRVLDKISKTLDGDKRAQGAAGRLVAQQLNRALEDCTVIQSQWGLVKAAVQSCISERLPRVLKAIMLTSVRMPGVVAVLQRFGQVQHAVRERTEETELLRVMLTSHLEVLSVRALSLAQ